MKKIKKQHTKHGFGEMLRLSWDRHKAEVMRFEKAGTPHTHDEVETAILLSGSGSIMVDGRTVSVDKVGQKVLVPPHTKHHMKPESEMVMVIYYGERV